MCVREKGECVCVCVCLIVKHECWEREGNGEWGVGSGE
jgi:hypothetical protein